MLVHEWKMPIHEAQLVLEALAKTSHPQKRLPAEWALKITIGDDGHGSRIRSEDMVVGA
jgi:hypothetical protein